MSSISLEHKKIVLKYNKDSIILIKVNDIIRCHAGTLY